MGRGVADEGKVGERQVWPSVMAIEVDRLRLFFFVFSITNTSTRKIARRSSNFFSCLDKDEGLRRLSKKGTMDEGTGGKRILNPNS
jgi:hypothetical protein